MKMSRAPNEYGRTTPRREDPVNGLLLVDKPADWTSHDVVAKLRNHFRLRKTGHGGTLDPMATGLLIILFGRGTKLSQRVMGTDKVYEGVIEFGKATNTHDIDGDVVEEKPIDGLTEAMVAAAMQARCGDRMQTPPMYSAVKKDGVPLYKLARKGQTVEREPRLIHVYAFKLLSWEPPRATFRLRCTKGTYVRVLAAEIGEELGCGAFLQSLRRLECGPYALENAVPLDTLLEEDIDALRKRVISPEEAPMDRL